METTRRAGLVAAILLLAVTPSAAPQSSRAPQNPTVPQNLPAPRRSTPPGDVYVSLATGPVQWRTSDGALRGELVDLVPGPAQGMRIDPSGNLYVARRCADASCTVGNSVEKFNPMGVSQGAVGGETRYNCNPHSIAFDAAGNTFVGQADCTGHVLQFTSDSTPHEHKVAPDSRGSAWIDLAGDGCTLLYTSRGPNVKRFDVCTKSQRPDFNVDLLPGGDKVLVNRDHVRHDDRATVLGRSRSRHGWILLGGQLRDVKRLPVRSGDRRGASRVQHRHRAAHRRRRHRAARKEAVAGAAGRRHPPLRDRPLRRWPRVTPA